MRSRKCVAIMAAKVNGRRVACLRPSDARSCAAANGAEQNKACGDPDKNHREALAEDQAYYLASGVSKRHADADFKDALAGEIREHAVDADAREQQRETRKNPEQQKKGSAGCRGRRRRVGPWLIRRRAPGRPRCHGVLRRSALMIAAGSPLVRTASDITVEEEAAPAYREPARRDSRF